MSVFQNFDNIPALPTSLDFDPVREAVTRNGSVVPDQFWIVNPNNGSLISNKPSGKHHNPVNYSLMWDSFRDGVVQSGIDTSQLEVRFNTASNSSAFAADIIFKKYDYQHIVGEATQMRMRIIDSHDQSFKRDIRCMLMRLACTNGMSSVGERLVVKQKHTMLSDPEKLGAVVSEFPTRLESEAELYKKMMNTKVSKDQAILYARATIATYRTVSGIKVKEKTVEEFARIWDTYNGMGDTGYRLYNVMTHIGTHVTGREGTDIARKQIRVEDKVSDLVQAPAFRQLVGLDLPMVA
jgi:hypothetical protein